MNTIHEQIPDPVPGLARLVTPSKVISFFAVNGRFGSGRIQNNAPLRLASKRKMLQAVVLRNNPPSAKFGYPRMSITIPVPSSSVDSPALTKILRGRDRTSTIAAR